MLRAWLAKVVDRFRRDLLDRELAEELRFHEQMLARDGEPAPRRRLGNVTRAREVARDHWSLGALDVLAQDVRYALRGLIKAPGFSAAVVITLGLGIGANVAMLSITDRLMFRPYPFLRDPASAHLVYLAYSDRGQQILNAEGLEYTRYLDLRRWSTTFSDFAAFRQSDEAVGSGNDAVERQVASVSGSFFGFFSMRPALGRFFGPADDSVPNGARVAVLGYHYWQQRFGGRNVLGQTLQVGDLLATIVGVAPEGFSAVADTPPDVLIPITAYASSHIFGVGYSTTYEWGWVSIMVRRKPGVTLMQASADLSHAYTLSWAAQRKLDPGSVSPVDVARPHAIVAPLKEGAGPDPGLQARTATWVLGVAGIVLLIACANVTNLYLVRGMRRRRETAVRLALGVSSRRMVLLYAVEGMTLAIIAGAAGLVLAQLSGGLIQHYFIDTGDAPFLLGDRRTILGTAIVTLLVGAITASVPLLMSRQRDLAGALKSGVRGGSRGRAQLSAGLLVLQGALSVMLLVGAGLFVRSVGHVSAMRLGYDSDRVLIAFVNRRGARLDDSGEVDLGRRVLAASQGIPGVQHAAWVRSIPFYSSSSSSLFVTGIDSVDKLGHFTYEAATGEYFATMGTRIVRGRGLLTSDRGGGNRVMVVSEAMAQALWPHADPIGQCVRVRADTMPCTTVVGIAENALQSSLTDEVPLKYYLPMDQFSPGRGFAVLLRTTAAPASQQIAVHDALQRIMPGQYYITTMPLASLIGRETESWHFGATMFSAFGLLALLVAGIGLYALVSYGVAQRSHELSVRVALGAQARDIVGLVVGQGMRFALAGVVLGVGLALMAARWVQPLLFHESARDPEVFVVVALVLLAVAIGAAMAPALRASQADPNAALRAD